MGKKEFIALANALRGVEVPNTVLLALLEFCRSQNSNFDEDKWLGFLRGENGPNGGPKKPRKV